MVFDPKCSTEKRHDPLCIMDAAGKTVAIRSGREVSEWSAPVVVPGKLFFSEIWLVDPKTLAVLWLFLGIFTQGS